MRSRSLVIVYRGYTVTEEAQRVYQGAERERKRGEEKEMSDSLRCVRECCPRDTVRNRSAIGPVFRTRRVSRQ